MRGSPVLSAVLGALLVSLLGGCGDSSPEPAPTSSETEPTAGVGDLLGADDPDAADDPAGAGDPIERADGDDQSEPTRLTPDPVSPQVSDDATRGTRQFLGELSTALRSPSAAAVDETRVRDAAAEAIRNQAAEYADRGWRVEGRPKILDIEVYERTDAEMVVGACLDNSAIRVIDADGNVVKDSSGDPPTRNLYTLAASPDGWVVVDHSFPSDPSC